MALCGLLSAWSLLLTCGRYQASSLPFVLVSKCQGMYAPGTKRQLDRKGINYQDLLVTERKRCDGDGRTGGFTFRHYHTYLPSLPSRAVENAPTGLSVSERGNDGRCANSACIFARLLAPMQLGGAS